MLSLSYLLTHLIEDSPNAIRRKKKLLVLPNSNAWDQWHSVSLF